MSLTTECEIFCVSLSPSCHCRPSYFRRKYALVFLPGLVTGRLFDIGYFKIPYFFGSCLLIVCTFLVAECKVYWQFFLAQGLGIGVSFVPV